MASWHYAFFFPSSTQQLRPELGLDVVSRCNLEFDNTIHLAASIDDSGHLAGVGEEDVLSKPILKALREILADGKQFLVECRNTELFISCTFLHKSVNPHVFFGWSKRLFAELPDSSQQQYLNMLHEFAKQICAGYVILVDDAPDFFEDRFLEIDGRRSLDTQVNHQYGLDIRAVWADRSAGAECPDGVADRVTADLGNGFVQYSVE